jgi:hypothetical protein
MSGMLYMQNYNIDMTLASVFITTEESYVFLTMLCVVCKKYTRYNLSYVIVNTKGNSYFTNVTKDTNVHIYNSKYIHVSSHIS